MEESGQGFYPFYSLSWGLGLYWVVNLGVEILYLGTIGFDVGLTVWHKFGLCEDGVKVGSDKSQSIECWDGLYGSYEMLVGSVKRAHPILSPNGRYVQADAFIDIVIALFFAITDDLRQIQELRLSPVKAHRVFSEHSKGSDRPELRLQRSIHNEAPSRKDTSGVTAGELGSHVRDKKKWRRFQRQACPASQIQGGEGEHSVRIRDVSEADSGTPPVGDFEGFMGTLASTSRLCSSLLRHEVGGIKRGVEPSSMDLVPSPQKKTRGPNPDTDRQVIQDGTMEVSDMWDQVEADAGENGSCVWTVCAGNLARGGGGWPSTAARSP
ncbi:hypothetical protein ACFX1Q_032105 [Malus domestica]